MSLKAVARSPPSAAVVQMVAARAARRRHGDQNAKCVSSLFFRKVWKFLSFILRPVFESGAESQLQSLSAASSASAVPRWDRSLHCPLPREKGHLVEDFCRWGETFPRTRQNSRRNYFSAINNQ